MQNKTLGEIVYFPYTQQNLATFGEVFVWDLDKTYLDTRIDSLGGLLGAVMERSLSKKNIPATNVLIRQLAEYWQGQKGGGVFPIFFITASPPQMEERIREKLSFDGIPPIGCYYKNNLRNLRPSRWWRLKRHVGYKISALLYLRAQLSETVQQVLWGDDSESDAIIYNLYSDICAGRIVDAELKSLLKKIGMAPDNIELIFELKAKIPQNDPVAKIYINLAIDTDHDYYLKFGRRTVATYNTLQVALDLFQDQRLSIEDVGLVYDEMIQKYGFTHEQLLKSFEEFVTRPQLGEQTCEQYIQFLKSRGAVGEQYELPLKPRAIKKLTDDNKRVLDLEGVSEPWTQEKIEYLNEYR